MITFGIFKDGEVFHVRKEDLSRRQHGPVWASGSIERDRYVRAVMEEEEGFSGAGRISERQTQGDGEKSDGVWHGL